MSLCYLLPMSLCRDLLFRLAEKPRIYTPVFSRMILAEVRRTHVEKVGWGEEITASGFAQLRWDEEIAEGTERGRVF